MTTDISRRAEILQWNTNLAPGEDPVARLDALREAGEIPLYTKETCPLIFQAPTVDLMESDYWNKLFSDHVPLCEDYRKHQRDFNDWGDSLAYGSDWTRRHQWNYWHDWVIECEECEPKNRYAHIPGRKGFDN